jgi:hypothetical protein
MTNTDNPAPGAALGHHSNLKSLELHLGGIKMPMAHLRTLFAAPATNLQSLTRFTLVLYLRGIERDSCYAFLPFEIDSHIDMLTDNKATVSSLVTQSTINEIIANGPSVLTSINAPRLQDFRVNLQGRGTLMVYPCSLFLNTLWEDNPGDVGLNYGGARILYVD